MTPTRSEIELLARQAGVILRTRFGQKNRIEQKATSIDLVTEADRASEAFLLGSLLDRYPTHFFLAEETGAHGDVGEDVWYVDPLDGTVNYAHGIPIYSVSIAYAKQNKIQIGVVYDPMQNECFSAERGHGAWLNGKPIRVTQVESLADALLVTGFPYDAWTNPNNNLDHYAKFAVRTQGVRRLGSAALDLCYVAAGRFDGFWELSLSPWDIAAGTLIAKEAGAKVTATDGSLDFITPPCSMLVANASLHTKMFQALKGDN